MHARLIRALAIPAATIGTLALAGAAVAPGAAVPARTPGPPPAAYVVNYGSNTVTAINTITSKPYSTIKVGAGPLNILVAPDGKTAYIAGMTGVTPVSTVTRKAGRLIALGREPILISADAVHMAITPNGKTLYVDGYGNTLIPVSTATGKAAKPIALPSWAEPGPLLITSNGRTLYVGTETTSAFSLAVIPVSTATGKAGKPITFWNQPVIAGNMYMAITPNGKTLYAFGSSPYGPGDTVTPISTATGKAGTPVKVGQYPDAIVVSPNGKMVYVASTGAGQSGCILQSPRCGPARIKSRPATVTPISTVTNRPGKAITLGPTASSLTMAITPNGKTVYVGDGAVIPISTATWKAGKPIKGHWAAGPMAITVGGTLYCVSATAGPGIVIPVRTATGTVLKAVNVGKWPIAIAIAR